ncbi:MAG: hypothetical protein IJT30_02155 [Muribaculaceae bacterium]|nr:hypothetical protein [Muribaculaceae bacterium]
MNISVLGWSLVVQALPFSTGSANLNSKFTHLLQIEQKKGDFFESEVPLRLVKALNGTKDETVRFCAGSIA